MNTCERYAIAHHYADDLHWFRDDVAEVWRERVRACIYYFIEVAEDLEECTRPVPQPGGIADWLSGFDPEGRLTMLIQGAGSPLDLSIGGLYDLSLRANSEMPYGVREVMELECASWPDTMTCSRPPLLPLIKGGTVEKEFVDHMRALMTGFRDLRRECMKLHSDIPTARSLLLRGLTLCVELQYVGAMLLYARHLHPTDEESEWGIAVMEEKAQECSNMEDGAPDSDDSGEYKGTSRE